MNKVVIFLAFLFNIAFGQNVLLTVPANPLTAAGLATPFINNLNQSIAVNSAFVEGTLFDPTTNTLFAYNPLVITVGTAPAIVPSVPNLNNGVVIGLWFGINGNSLTLTDNANGANLNAGNCVNGITGSIFDNLLIVMPLIFLLRQIMQLILVFLKSLLLELLMMVFLAQPPEISLLLIWINLIT